MSGGFIAKEAEGVRLQAERDRERAARVAERRAELDAAEKARNAAMQARVDARHNLRTEIAAELRDIRERLGLTQSEMAATLGVRDYEYREAENVGSMAVERYERLLNAVRAAEKMRGGGSS